jgi:hypothetical protein
LPAKVIKVALEIEIDAEEEKEENKDTGFEDAVE